MKPGYLLHSSFAGTAPVKCEGHSIRARSLQHLCIADIITSRNCRRSCSYRHKPRMMFTLMNRKKCIIFLFIAIILAFERSAYIRLVWFSIRLFLTRFVRLGAAIAASIPIIAITIKQFNHGKTFIVSHFSFMCKIFLIGFGPMRSDRPCPFGGIPINAPGSPSATPFRKHCCQI